MELVPDYGDRELSEEHRQALWDEALGPGACGCKQCKEEVSSKYKQLVQQAIADKREAEDYKREQLFEERGY